MYVCRNGFLIATHSHAAVPTPVRTVLYSILIHTEFPLENWRRECSIANADLVSKYQVVLIDC